MYILLVEPEFPIPAKSKNHSNFLPIGLLKLASYHRSVRNTIRLIRGNVTLQFEPDEILITSIFTYWSRHVKDSVQFYRKQFPRAKITVGGIYASLMPEHCKNYTECDEVFIGIHKDAENLFPAYDLIDVDYQIIHGMRGCTRTCSFCGIWKLEKLNFKNSDQILSEIKKNKLVFYDNNMLVNPNIENILEMLAEIRINGKVVKCECQSGFDGRILEEKPHLAVLLKKARFQNVRIAWDFSLSHYAKIERWIQILEDASYKRNNIFVFMIYNWNYPFEEMEFKRKKCFEFGVQVSDCRYRPLDFLYDDYNPFKWDQTNIDYYIHSTWNDYEIKQFRRNVRQHNICIRHRISFDKYSREIETNAQKAKSFSNQK